MAYSIKPSDPSLRSAFQRIASDQLQSALDELGGGKAETLDARVHSARKRCKKLRGLARLVRPGFDGYAELNAALRDAARSLSELRDAAAFIETYDTLAATAPPDFDRRRIAPIRSALTRAQPSHEELGDRVEAFRQVLGGTMRGVPDWRVEGVDEEILFEGLARPFKRARKAIDRASRNPDGRTMHEWRKRVKYHWYHARLLDRIFPEMTHPHRDLADCLADKLGDHHDLAEFAVRLGRDDMPADAAVAIQPLVVARMGMLESDAFGIGRPLFAETADAFAARWTAWWRLWRDGR